MSNYSELSSNFNDRTYDNETHPITFFTEQLHIPAETYYTRINNFANIHGARNHAIGPRDESPDLWPTDNLNTDTRD